MNKLAVGSVITLTTRYKNDNILVDGEWNDTTYENVTVLSSEPWMKSDQIKVSSDTPRMPFRVINMKNIHDASVDLDATAESGVREVTVKGSKGKEYTVMVQDGVGVSCTCPGFTYRRHCRHLTEVEE